MRRLLLNMLLVSVSTVLPAWAAEIPALPEQTVGKVLHRFDYADSTAARHDWHSAYGSPPVTANKAGSRNILRFPCTFVGNKLDRGCWDWPVDLDLTACRGVQMRVFCPDISAINGMTFYLQSGNGWYGINFNPAETGRWCTVALDKTQAIPEGNPAGWSKITQIRFSAWRAGDKNGEVCVADLVMLGADAPIAVLKPAASKNAEADRKAQRALSSASRLLQELGAPYFTAAEAELKPEYLADCKVIVLPGDLQPSENLAGMLKTFTDRGGKLLSLGTAPASFDPKTVVSTASFPWPGELAEQCRAMLTALNEANPSVCEEIAAHSLECMTHLGSDEPGEYDAAPVTGTIGERVQKAFAAVKTSIATAAEQVPARKAQVAEQLDEASKLCATALSLNVQGKHIDVYDTAEQSRRKLIDAYCTAQAALPGEHRAFWCHSALGVEGMSWDDSIRTLAENGFTAILPNMLWGGLAYYKSDVLPVWHEVSTRGDLLAECLAACKKYGIECHVWKVNWNMDGRAPREFIERMKAEGRTQVTFEGQSKEQWLCPSNPANRQLEIDAMLEVATKYNVDGIHFDYIRYPGLEGCFCDGCRQRFEQVIGHKVEHWPADTRQDPKTREQWLDWRRSNITAVVAGVAERVRAVRPRVKISAAVFRVWPTERDSIGQDWKLWCDKGYLDFVCPMDYTPNVPQLAGLVQNQMEWAGRVPCYPGIGLSVWPDRNDICRLIDQIKVTRDLHTGGFTVFNYAENEAHSILPLLGKGTTKKE